MTLKELADKNIDLWVEAVSNVVNDPVLFTAVIDAAYDEEIRRWLVMDRCPGEFERAIDIVCGTYEVRFDADGRIVQKKEI